MKNSYALLLLCFLGCSTSAEQPSTPNEEAMYFPPLVSTDWETKSVSALGWNEDAVAPLLDFVEDHHTKGFIVLVNGKIVIESYFNGHTAEANWYWASAGKTLTTAMVGIAEQDNFLDIDDTVTDYLDQGWTSLPLEKENLITNRHLLTMTSGIDDGNGDCVVPECLTYIADAGTRWAYHNAYVKLQDVIAAATNQSYISYFNARLRNKIGMNGGWFTLENNEVYFSSTRSMARFGLLMLNQGKWENEVIVNQAYCHDATVPSQNLNKSYGYLWWINGESSYRLPQTQLQLLGTLIDSGPSDMYMALGKNDQKIYIIPSMKMVVIRMGEVANPDNPTFALSGFDAELWVKIKALYQ